MPGQRLRGTLIIQFVSGIRLCSIQDVQGLGGLKVGCKWLSSAGHATGPSLKGS